MCSVGCEFRKWQGREEGALECTVAMFLYKRCPSFLVKGKPTSVPQLSIVTCSTSATLEP